MSARSVSDNLHQAQGDAKLRELLKLVTAMQKKSPRVDDDYLTRYLMYSPERDYHGSNLVTVSDPFATDDEILHYAGIGPYRQIPDSPRARPKSLYVQANADAEFIPAGGIEDGPARKLGGGATGLDFSIPAVDPGDECTVGMWLWLPEATHTEEFLSFAGVSLEHSTGGTLQAVHGSGSASLGITRQAWRYVAWCHWQNRVQLFRVDGSGDAARSTMSAGVSLPDDSPLTVRTYDGCYIAHLSVFAGRPAGGFSDRTAWVEAAGAGRIGYATGYSGGTLDEITSYSFGDSRKPDPVIRAGLFYAR